MTSFIISAHEKRPLHPSWEKKSGCVFCDIISGTAESFKIYETDKLIAILDIHPLREGHTLVIPKYHCARVSELPAEYAGATGEAVSKVANALTHAIGRTGLNIVCNQEYAQAVDHVHYHIIPAPTFDSPPATSNVGGDHVTRALTQKEIHKLEFENRSVLEDEESHELVKRMQARL